MPGRSAKVDRFSIGLAHFVEICKRVVKARLICLLKVFELDHEKSFALFQGFLALISLTMQNDRLTISAYSHNVDRAKANLQA